MIRGRRPCSSNRFAEFANRRLSAKSQIGGGHGYLLVMSVG
jgi:hypothetical protein